MRHILNIDVPALKWLCDQDGHPNVLPIFPADAERGLVVAHLVSGQVIAEVIPTPAHVNKICGSGLPLGRLYFCVEKKLLYALCPQLSQSAFDKSE